MVVPSIPYLLDPTRKVDTSAKFIMFDRSIIEMHHMSFVRRNIRFVSFDRGVSVRNLNQIEDADVINAALVNECIQNEAKQRVEPSQLYGCR